MMHPPTALPRSLAEHINPPPVDPIVRDSPHGCANERPPSLLARLFRRSGRQAARPDELDDADEAIAVVAEQVTRRELPPIGSSASPRPLPVRSCRRTATSSMSDA